MLIPKRGADLWRYRLIANGLGGFTFDFLVAVVMSAAFVIASPDTWKRVHSALRKSDSPRVAFLKILVAGAVPFALMLPIAVLAEIDEHQIQDPVAALSYAMADPFPNAILCVGIVSTFLSSFDSTLVSSVHILLTTRESKKSNEQGYYTRDNYYGLLATALIASVGLLVLMRVSTANPYFVANILTIGYALFAAAFAAGAGSTRRLKGEQCAIIGSLLVLAWFMYIVSDPSDRLDTISIRQIDSVPFGVGCFLLFFGVCRFSSERIKTNE